MEQKLPPGEWLVIVAVVAVMALLTVVAFVSDRHMTDHNLDSPHHLISQEIDVFVEGAVEHPGAFTVKRGAVVQDVLDRAKLRPEANLSKLKMTAKLRNGQRVRVPAKEMITIILEGAVVHPGPHRVFKGMRWDQLSEVVELAADADVKFLKKKKRLKDQDVVHVKSRKG